MSKYVFWLVVLFWSHTTVAQDLEDLEGLEGLENLENLEGLEELDGLESLGDISIDGGELKVGKDLKIDADGIQVNDQLKINTEGLVAGNTAIKMNQPGGKVYNDDDFFGVNWMGKTMSGVTFNSVNFYNANLSGVDFSNAVFLNTDFSETNLDDTCFYGATFTNTDVDEGSSMVNTNLTNSIQANSDFMADTSQVIWKNTPCGVSAGRELSRREVSSRADFINAQTIIAGLSLGEQSGVDLTINFATDSATITGKARAQVYEVAKALESDALQGFNFMIEGHTDSDGDDEYNVDLSYRRALAVSKTLNQEYGIASERLSIEGFGESNPVTVNSSAQGKAINRRVTIVNLGIR